MIIHRIGSIIQFVDLQELELGIVGGKISSVETWNFESVQLIIKLLLL
jgi:hypothetical protein